MNNTFFALTDAILDELRTLIEAAGGDFIESTLKIEVKRAWQMITDYCHEVVPDHVYIAYIPKMIFDLHRAYHQQGTGVQSISEQGTSITYAPITAAGSELETIFEAIKPFLNKYRRGFFK